ncbi:polysaccharide deacetylase family protein [Clostridium boliviensis]|uniref:Polysaccharide deacetylase family protein n=1 Tax=Clostridium boliviensis TaxID=318465 RepID=A0ABU4GQD3_9CLOT|nr:polysaccharide deacetylase family protein [Clostridium boliviensis]MDW2799804.1 polysaccharide deacetylase family protein [Clostridium boliviensis]
MKKFLQLGMGVIVLALIIAFIPASPFPSMAYETAAAAQETAAEVRGRWIDENLGPGVARWVDEYGNVSSQPGKQEEIQTEKATQSQAEAVSQTTADTSQQETADNDGQPAGRVIDPSRPMVALTFDDGPYAPVGNQIMDSLAQYGGKATFFVVGNRAAYYPDELKRMAAEGHEIGNHTYEHKYLNKLGPQQIQSQINRCNDAVQAVCGVRPVLVRLPGGNKNSTVLQNVHAPMIMWSIDTLDWKTRNTAKTIQTVMSRVRDGDIVLMHELYPQSGAAAIEIIRRLSEEGYQLVTVSELASYRGGVVPGGVYSQFYR